MPIVGAHAAHSHRKALTALLLKEEALSASGEAAIEVADGAEIVGPVESGDKGKILGLPGQEKKQAKRNLSQAFGKGACAAVIRCHKEHQAFGNVQGLVSRFDP